MGIAEHLGEVTRVPSPTFWRDSHCALYGMMETKSATYCRLNFLRWSQRQLWRWFGASCVLFSSVKLRHSRRSVAGLHPPDRHACLPRCCIRLRWLFKVSFFAGQNSWMLRHFSPTYRFGSAPAGWQNDGRSLALQDVRPIPKGMGIAGADLPENRPQEFPASHHWNHAAVGTGLISGIVGSSGCSDQSSHGWCEADLIDYRLLG